MEATYSCALIEQEQSHFMLRLFLLLCVAVLLPTDRAKTKFGSSELGVAVFVTIIEYSKTGFTFESRVQAA